VIANTKSHSRVSISDTTLHVNINFVDTQAPWVVLSNSLATNTTIFHAQAEALEGRFNILRYDQRGHGKSDVSTGFNFDTLGNDVIALLDHVGAKSCTYVGLSMGVPTGLAAYAKANNRFDALVFLDGQPVSMPDAAEQWQIRIDTARKNGMDEFAKALVSRWLVTDDAIKSSALEQIITTTPLEGFIAAASCLKSYDYSHVIPEIKVPVLTIAGDQDGAMPEKMKSLAGQVKQGRYKSIPQAGHVPCFEQPDSVNNALSTFLGEI